MKHFAIIMLSILSLFISAAYANSLEENEIDDLLFMTEEEKLAHDVYLVFQRKYRDRVFPNIRRSEQQHMDAMAGLLDRYGLENPSLPGVGEFENQSLQGLYDELIARGMKSRIDAIKVGALIEEKDMIDIVAAMEGTDEPAIKRVYSKLLDGSKSHLKAFVYRLERLGVDYQPVLMDKVDYVAIVGT